MRRSSLVMTAVAAALLPAQAPARAQEADAGPALADYRAAVAELRADMLRPGAPVAGWDAGGADPIGDLRAIGAEDHYLLNTGAGGAGLSISTTRPIAAFAPAGWRIVDSFGSSSTPVEHAQVDFQAFSERYVLGTRAGYRRRGTADCTSGIANALLFERPEVPASSEDRMVLLFFRLSMLAVEGQEICVRSDGDARRGYTTRTFLPDGRPLPRLTRPGGLTTIVPAAPIDRLVRWQAVPSEPAATD